MSEQNPSITIDIPEWVADYIKNIDYLPKQEDRAAFVIKASSLNVQHRTGGPFAAGVFESKTGKLVSLGINLVTSQKLSVLHAEMMALILAQRKLGSYDLSLNKTIDHELVSSTEPCAMCFGAIPWSGVTSIVCCASGSDACAIGFDEGDKPEQWQESLLKRGLNVKTLVLRDQAQKVLQEYAKTGVIYNSRT